MTLFPVILPVDEATDGLSGEEKVARLSRIARDALRLSAAKSGMTVENPVKDGDDVPLPSNGTYWSISHKPKGVAAVVSRKRIGIDIEEIAPRSEQVFTLVASDEEWALSGDISWNTFFRYWTAKEAVLKAAGVGISGLKKCRVISIPDETHMVLAYKAQEYVVEQRYFNKHMVSVLKDDNEIRWIIAGDFEQN